MPGDAQTAVPGQSSAGAQGGTVAPRTPTLLLAVHAQGTGWKISEGNGSIEIQPLLQSLLLWQLLCAGLAAWCFAVSRAGA